MGPVFAGRQGAHHAETVHPDEEGCVGYIKKIRVRNPMPSDIPMNKGTIISRRLKSKQARG